VRFTKSRAARATLNPSGFALFVSYMKPHPYVKPHFLTGLIGMLLLWAPYSFAAPPQGSPAARQDAAELARLPPVTPHGGIDHSGRKQMGRASYYANRFAHRTMTDGHRLDPNAHAAASKTLPLGTTAKVTNLQNGRSTMVTVEDRGPFKADRVVDVTPKAADELDMKKRGVAPVIVAPVAVPLPNGEVKLGAGAAEASPGEIRTATERTMQSAAR
jgi:rare lipoprotein A